MAHLSLHWRLIPLLTASSNTRRYFLEPKRKNTNQHKEEQNQFGQIKLIFNFKIFGGFIPFKKYIKMSY